MDKQGIKTTQKGVCGACRKPIVGQVMLLIFFHNYLVIYNVSFLFYTSTTLMNSSQEMALVRSTRINILINYLKGSASQLKK